MSNNINFNQLDALVNYQEGTTPQELFPSKALAHLEQYKCATWANYYTNWVTKGLTRTVKYLLPWAIPVHLISLYNDPHHGELGTYAMWNQVAAVVAAYKIWQNAAHEERVLYDRCIAHYADARAKEEAIVNTLCDQIENADPGLVGKIQEVVQEKLPAFRAELRHIGFCRGDANKMGGQLEKALCHIAAAQSKA